MVPPAAFLVEKWSSARHAIERANTRPDLFREKDDRLNFSFENPGPLDPDF